MFLYARRFVWKAIGVVYPIAVVLTTIVTGNHFILDAVAGVLAVFGFGFVLAAGPFERDVGRLMLATRGGSSQVARRVITRRSQVRTLSSLFESPALSPCFFGSLLWIGFA